MTKQLINVGASPNDNRGDSLRVSFQKINANFTELYTTLDGFELANSIPNLSGNSGKYLTNNGTNLEWETLIIPSGSSITANGHTISVNIDGEVTVDGDPLSVIAEYHVPIDHVPPVGPVAGDLWFDTESGRLYIYYDTSWVDANPKGQTGSTIPNQNTHSGGFLTTDGSNLSWGSFGSVGTSIVPSTANTYDLGSLAKPWRSLYVSTSTIYLGGTPLSINEGGELLVDGSPVSGGAANLGQFRISGNTLGTIDGEGGWGGYDININPGAESPAYIFIPGLESQADDGALQIFNRATASSPLQLFGRGNVQVITGLDETERVFTFVDDKLQLPIGGDIVDSNGNSVLGGAVVSDNNVWVETFATTDGPEDIPQLALSVEYDADGNVIALFNHTKPNGGGQGVENRYFSIAKFDTLGNKLWLTRIIDGTLTDGWGLAVDRDNDYIYVAGSLTAGLPNRVSTLTKFDASTGNLVWMKTYDFGFDSDAAVVDVATDGNPVMVGLVWANDAFTFTQKINADTGWVEWSRKLDGPNFEIAYGMAVGPAGEIITIGQIDSLGANSEDRMLVTKYDSVGSLQWQKAILFDIGYDCRGADADIDSLGNIYICGSYYQPTESGSQNALSIIKLDGNGDKQWSRRIVGDCEDYAASIVVGADDRLYLSAITGAAGASDYSFVVAKYTEDGLVDWQRILDNTTTWTLAGGLYYGLGAGSNIAVKDGYVAVAGTFGDPFGAVPHAMIAQFDAAGTTWRLGPWNYKAASFTGLLNSTASDISVDTADRIDSDLSGDVAGGTLSPSITQDDMLKVARINQTQNLNEAILLSSNVVKNAFGYQEVETVNIIPGGTHGNGYLSIYPTFNEGAHLHLSTGDPNATFLYLGDDTTFVRTGYSGQGVSIGTNGGDMNYPTGKLWAFDTDGDLTIPGSVKRGGVTSFYSEVSNNSSGLFISGDKTGGGTAIVYSTNNVILRSDNNGTSKDLIFATDGGLSLPASGFISGELLPGSGDTAAASGANSYGGPNAQFGQNNFTSGTLSSITVGWTVSGPSGFIGTITLVNGYGVQGLLTLDVGQDWGGVGPFTFYAPDYIGTTYGSLEVKTGATNSWTFGTGGVFSLGADIGAIYADQTTGVITIADFLSSEGTPAMPSTSIHIGGTGNAFVISRGNGENNPSWEFKDDGSTTLPGAVIKSTVAKDFTAGTGIPLTLADSTWGTALVDGSYGPFTYTGITFTAVVTSGVAAYTITANSGPIAINTTIVALDASELGGAQGNTSNISVSNVLDAVAIDLTKSVNKLADGDYTLANGVEGQIMYLVAQDGANMNLVNVLVHSARVNGGTYADVTMFPFLDYNAVANSGMCTVIFTDGCWQSNSGWD